MKTNKDLKAKELGNSVKGPEATHTPTPWVQRGPNSKGHFVIAEVVIPNRLTIADVFREENAAFIVRAVNAYDGLKADHLKSLKLIASDAKEIVTLTEQRNALLEAAKIGLSFLESDYVGSGGKDLSNGAIKKVKKAIALASEAQPNIRQAEGK